MCEVLYAAAGWRGGSDLGQAVLMLAALAVIALATLFSYAATTFGDAAALYLTGVVGCVRLQRQLYCVAAGKYHAVHT
jgi:hypothetical protein